MGRIGKGGEGMDGELGRRGKEWMGNGEGWRRVERGRQRSRLTQSYSSPWQSWFLRILRAVGCECQVKILAKI